MMFSEVKDILFAQLVVILARFDRGGEEVFRQAKGVIVKKAHRSFFIR
jgi:hypothetical protein